jgi:hypothetical protein
LLVEIPHGITNLEDSFIVLAKLSIILLLKAIILTGIPPIAWKSTFT